MPDTTVTALKTFVYKVRAIDSAMRPSPLSIPDAATTLFFSNDPLVAKATIVTAAHITELRQGVNLMRTAGGIGTTSFTDASLAGVPIRALHLDELRTNLTAARAALGLPPITYTDSSLAGVVVNAVHVQELRNGVK